MLVIALMMTGMYLILSKSNMVKTIIGLNFFQVSVIMFYVSMGKIEHGTAPILYGEDVPHATDEHSEDHSGEHGLLDDNSSDVAFVAAQPSAVGKKGKSSGARTLNAYSSSQKQEEIKSLTQMPSGTIYSNPLPHVLMLTAIVVGVATTALALSLVVRINEAFGTIEEDELEDQGVLS
ncbi:MAG: hypothetical protein CMK59_04025 [Proteobacteria bacterium]|nr:hypothetical protein [Pseudomonadota bacterium]